MVQKLLQHQQQPPPAIDSLRVDVSRRLAAILARLMEKDPADRYQRPADLVADLVACAEAEGLGLVGGLPAVSAGALAEPARQRALARGLGPGLELLALIRARRVWGGGE
ncbi:MAG: hypothetical protein ACKON7_03645, partial [Planctomycetaceae bacterium]